MHQRRQTEVLSKKILKGHIICGDPNLVKQMNQIMGVLNTFKKKKKITSLDKAFATIVMVKFLY